MVDFFSGDSKCLKTSVPKIPMTQRSKQIIFKTKLTHKRQIIFKTVRKRRRKRKKRKNTKKKREKKNIHNNNNWKFFLSKFSPSKHIHDSNILSPSTDSPHNQCEETVHRYLFMTRLMTLWCLCLLSSFSF